jgi:hypothetical protein
VIDSQRVETAGTPLEVALVFPPLVENNFGHYYPSTAVLTGYLKSHGFASIQTDLNEEFAVNIIKPENLVRMGKGDFGNGILLPPEEMPAVAARILLRSAGLLLDENGRHSFRDDNNDMGYLLKILVQPYRIDEPMSRIEGSGFHSWPRSLAYMAFFEQTGYAEALPASVCTVGVSVPMGPQLIPSLILARYLRAHRPDLKVVLGGSTFSLMPETDLERILNNNPDVAAVVRFEGEFPLRMIAEQGRTKAWQWSRLPGLSWHAGNKIFHNPPVEGLNMAWPAFAEYDAGLLSHLSRPEIGIMQSRSCYWGKCVYCDYTELNRCSPSFRARTPASFIDELEYQMARHGVHNFSVITDAIAPAFAGKISKLIIQRGLRIKWHSFAMIDPRFTPELFELMVKAGCEYLAVGVETLTDRVLRIMHKAATEEDTVRFLKDARAAGMRTKINLIPNLPSTTYEEAMSSLATLNDLQDCFSYVSVFSFETTRSSQVGKEPGKFGLALSDSTSSSGQAQFALNHLEVIDPAMSAEQYTRVFAAYQGFAAQINERRINDTLTAAWRENDINSANLRLADDILDFIELRGSIQCFNLLTKEKFLMPGGILSLITRMRAKKRFTKIEFMEWFSESAVGEYYFKKITDKGMLAINGPKYAEN